MGKENNFLKHFIIIGGGTIVNMLLGVFTTPIITRIVDPQDYGQLSLFTMYSGMCVMVLCLGLDQALIRYYYDQKNIHSKRDLLYKCIKLPVIFTILFSIVLITIYGFCSANFEVSFLLIFLFFVYTLLQIIYRFSLLLIRLEYKSKLYSLLNVIQKISYISFALPLIIIVLKKDLYSLALATVMSIFICTVISIYSQKSIWGLKKTNDYSSNVNLKELITYGYPYIFTMGITTLFQGADKIVLNMFCSYSDIGIYASTSSLVSIFAIVQTTFNSLWAPMSMEHYSTNPNEKEFYQRGNQMITVIMFLLGITLILFKDVFSFLLGAKYRKAAFILPFMAFNPIMYTISETTVSGLVFKKKSKLQIVVALGSCIFNIVGNFILVPSLGCKGAAISTGLSYCVFWGLRTFLSNKYFYVDFKLKKFTVILICLIIFALYNTFYTINLISVFMYLIFILIIFVLYKDTVKFGLDYCMKSISKFIKK